MATQPLKSKLLDLVENHKLIRRTLLVWYMVVMSGMLSVLMYQFLNHPQAIGAGIVTIYTAAFTWVTAIGALYLHTRGQEDMSNA